MTRVFIVEDNKNITEALESYLELEDYETKVFYQINGVMEAIKMLPPRFNSSRCYAS
jgi:DNA-binding NtrC family response regulator